MPIFLAALLGGLVDIAGTLVGRVLLSLGMGYVSYSGIDTSLAWMRDYVVMQLGFLPGNTLAVIGSLRVGAGISILTSALLARLTLDGLTGGVIKRLVQK